MSCERKPFVCPIVPLQKCEWQGQFNEIEGHFREAHSECVLEDLKVMMRYSNNTGLFTLYRGILVIS